jgi:enterobactin synthetase component D
MMQRVKLHPLLVPAGVTMVCIGRDRAARRQADFLGGRHCARESLRACAPELADTPIGVGRHREPLWPAGIVGSIAHASSYVVAAAARRRDARAVGIDVAPWLDDAAPQRIGSSIAVADELEAIRHDDWSLARRLTLVFSAKESIYKALFPLAQCVFGFEHARLGNIEPDDAISGRFDAHLTMPLAHLPANMPLSGRYECRDDAVLTTLVL